MTKKGNNIVHSTYIFYNTLLTYLHTSKNFNYETMYLYDNAAGNLTVV